MLVEWSDEDQASLVTLSEWAGRVLGAVAHGETYEEAVHNGPDALTALVASAEQHGEPVPAPRVVAPAHAERWHVGAG